jgi:hypothetical protein
MASISGRFEMPASNQGLKNYCGPWFTEDYFSYCDGGLSNVTIILYNDLNNIPLDYTLTDYEGRFLFNGLPYGKYIIDAEKQGFETTLSPLIEVNREVQARDNIRLRIEQNNKIGVYVPEIELTVNAGVYPNPANDVIHVNMSCDNPLEIRIFNLFGQQLIFNESRNIQISDTDIALDISHLSNGMYVGYIYCGDGIKTFNFFVKR